MSGATPGGWVGMQGAYWDVICDCGRWMRLKVNVARGQTNCRSDAVAMLDEHRKECQS